MFITGSLVTRIIMLLISVFRIPNPQKLIATLYAMHPDEQLMVLDALCANLEGKGLVNCAGLYPQQ